MRVFETLENLFGERRPSALATGPPSAPQVRYRNDPVSANLYAAEIAFREEVQPRLLVGPEIATFVADTVARPWPPQYPCAAWPIRVDLVPFTWFAFYENGTITVSSPVDVTVILHELAHHFAPFALASTRDFHGPTFMGAYTELLTQVLGPEVAAVFDRHFTERSR
jgi:hypothetical protein